MEKSTSCEKLCKGIDLPTDDEVEALCALKALKLRVREIKKRISESPSSKEAGAVESLLTLEEELVRLKNEWNHWEEKRRKAAKERMIRLGHEKRE